MVRVLVAVTMLSGLSGCLVAPGETTPSPLRGMVVLPDGSNALQVSNYIRGTRHATRDQVTEDARQQLTRRCPAGIEMVSYSTMDATRGLSYTYYDAVVKCRSAA